jgi:polyhydroxyalkanoate synthase subunit PhaC
VPPEACESLIRYVGSADTENVCLDTGHIGIYVSGKCQKEFAPKIATWLKDRDAVETPRKTHKFPTKRKSLSPKTALTEKGVRQVKTSNLPYQTLD